MGHFYSRLNETSEENLSDNKIEDIHSLNIHVEKIFATIDNKPTEIEEKSNSVLKYKTPYFR